MKQWTAFGLLGLIWGSSFLWIRIAVSDTGPVTLVALRLLFGLLGLLAVVAFRKQKFPRDRRTILALIVMGFLNTALPFTLISWGETRIESGLASVLNGTVPLFAFVIAHFWLHDERMTTTRMFGLIVGFAGVFVLVGRDIGLSHLSEGFFGQLAVVGASLSYALSATFSRRYLRNMTPVVQATGMVFFADAIVWLSLPGVARYTPMVDAPNHFPTLPVTWFALLWLGLLGSCAAYLLYFYLLNTWGVTRSSVVTYVLPVVGLVLGIIFLGEELTPNLAIGTSLVLGALFFVHRKPGPQATND